MQLSIASSRHLPTSLRQEIMSEKTISSCGMMPDIRRQQAVVVNTHRAWAADMKHEEAWEACP